MDWEVKCDLVNNFSLDMWRAGHSQSFREVVVSKAIAKYKASLSRHMEGERPMYRNRWRG